MTYREFLQAVVEITQETNPEVADYAFQKAKKMDEDNEKRRRARLKKQKPLMEETLKLLTDEVQTTSEIAEIMELTPQKISHILRSLVEAGLAEDSLVKGKSGRPVKGYTLVD